MIQISSKVSHQLSSQIGNLISANQARHQLSSQIGNLISVQVRVKVTDQVWIKVRNLNRILNNTIYGIK